MQIYIAEVFVSCKIEESMNYTLVAGWSYSGEPFFVRLV